MRQNRKRFVRPPCVRFKLWLIYISGEKCQYFTTSFTPKSEAKWQLKYANDAEHEVICHNDAAYYNLVFRNGEPAALIDFDIAGPGPLRACGTSHIPFTHRYRSGILCLTFLREKWK
ncbi:phosphotransferase [Paenibacillus contaminans]|uniref:Aminoglycoside phosphotransferase domain-containing protein n=1 Tax=Paenibacillus contaminans TaxID=450362 RepID=A0A329M0N4_9BACL|nr:hypothetical protein DQG23_33235 [Paenibacillus contaminans]